MSGAEQTTALVGRSAELEVLAGLLHGVVRGKGGTLLVHGEAGIGKSRILAEAAAMARERGVEVLVGRCFEGSSGFGPVTEALIGLLPDGSVPDVPALRPYRPALSSVLPGAASADPLPTDLLVDPVVVLGEALVRLTAETCPQGCLLVFEDLHWADADTVALVDYLVRPAQGWPLLVAASVRDDEPDSTTLRRLAMRRDLVTMRLPRLSESQCSALATALAEGRLPPEDLVRLSERSAGLPLFVEELTSAWKLSQRAGTASSWTASTPATLVALLADRVGRLKPEHLRVIETAAVLGLNPRWDLLPQVADLPDDVVATALESAIPGLLTRTREGLTWRHALMREAVLATLLPPRHAALAERAADALTAENDRAMNLVAAGLLVEAGEVERAAALYLDSAKELTQRGAVGTASDLLDRAASLCPAHPRVATQQVIVLTLQGKIVEALDLGTRALDTSSGEEHAALALELAHAAVMGNQWAAAEGFLERAGRPDEPQALLTAAEAAFGAGADERAALLAARAVESAESRGEWDVMCRALTAVGRSEMRRRPSDAETAFRRAVQTSAEHRLVPARVNALIGLSTVELFVSATPSSLLEARELALDNGLLAMALSADLLLVDALSTVEGPRASEDRAREAAIKADRLGLPGLQALAELFLAQGRAAAGDRVGMEASISAAMGRSHTSGWVPAMAPAVRAVLSVMQRDLPGATRLLDQTIPVVASHGTSAPVGSWGLWALLRTVQGDRDHEAREELRAAPAVFRALNRGALQYADAVAAHRAGELERASSLMAAAEQALAEQHWWRRLLRLILAEVLVDEGWAEALPLLRADLEIFERNSEVLLARTSRALLRQAGVDVRKGRGSATVPVELRALGVTSREVDVLRLVTEGLTNHEIALRLTLSRRTVETHVASLLSKTGHARRAGLCQLAVGQTQDP